MYNSIIRLLCIVLCVHHHKSSLLPSLLILSLRSSASPHPPLPLAVTILLSVSMSFWFLLFLILLICFTFSTQFPTLTAVSLFSVSVSLFLFCLLVYFVHLIPHMSEIMYLSFSVWLISLSIILSRSSLAVLMVRFPSFFMTE